MQYEKVKIKKYFHMESTGIVYLQGCQHGLSVIVIWKI